MTADTITIISRRRYVRADHRKCYSRVPDNENGESSENVCEDGDAGGVTARNNRGGMEADRAPRWLSGLLNAENEKQKYRRTRKREMAERGRGNAQRRLAGPLKENEFLERPPKVATRSKRVMETKKEERVTAVATNVKRPKRDEQSCEQDGMRGRARKWPGERRRSATETTHGASEAEATVPGRREVSGSLMAGRPEPQRGHFPSRSRGSRPRSSPTPLRPRSEEAAAKNSALRRPVP
ncbi:hypothetical protein MRX96_030741 [Rhipicephalus microplus]